MDQSTYDVRRTNWLNIIEQCQQRPKNMTAKQWLANNGIKEKLAAFYGDGNWRQMPDETYKRLRYEPASWTVEFQKRLS